MSGDLNNKNTEFITRAAFLCVALVLLVFILRPGMTMLTTPSDPQPTPSPPPSDPPSTPVLTLFGASSDPFCAPLYPALEDLCTSQGWRLVSYDCRGYATTQKGQIKDFIRTESADIVVLYSVLEQDELDEQAAALYKLCPVITVGQKVGTAAERFVSGHVGADETERISAITDYLEENIKGNGGVHILFDFPDEDYETLCAETFSQENIPVLGKNYTWDNAFYAERYLETALDEFPDTQAVVCTSRHGTAGTLDTLREKDLRDQVKIVSFNFEPAMTEEIALGGLDAAVAVSPNEAGELLEEILPKVLKGERPGTKNLTLYTLTSENVDTLDLGY